ncbi:MAG: IMP cyclohydrolase [Evtepia sp.]
MSVYETKTSEELLSGNRYPGRGIMIGKSADGTKAAIAYFIMGRSENSRNRIFVEKGDEVEIYPFDASKVEDPSLIIYAPIRPFGSNQLIVTNGDQTDTIYDGLQVGKCFSEALKSRAFEPDAPNFTPRISGLLTFDWNKKDFSYEMSILKSADEHGTACHRYTFEYAALAGVGHFIHTYRCDGNPIPTFQGEPERVSIPNDIDVFASELWSSLDQNNKISLYVRYVDLESGTITNKLINKNIGEVSNETI